MVNLAFCQRLIWIIPLVFLLQGCLGSNQDHQDYFDSEAMQPWLNKFYGPSGLAWTGREFAVGTRNLIQYNRPVSNPDRDGEFLLESTGFFDRNKMGVMRNRFPMPAGVDMNICGLAWEGKCCGPGALWVADSRYNRLLKLDEEHNIINMFNFAGFHPLGVAHDGKDLWVADAYNPRREAVLYRISSSNGEVLEMVKSPLARPIGLVSECESGSEHCPYLWELGFGACGSSNRQCSEPKLVKLDMRTREVVGEIVLPAAIDRPSTLTMTNSFLWVADFTKGNVHKVDPKKLVAPTVDWKTVHLLSENKLTVDSTNGKFELRVSMKSDRDFDRIEQVGLVLGSSQDQSYIAMQSQENSVSVAKQYRIDEKQWIYTVRGTLPRSTQFAKVKYNSAAEVQLYTDRAGKIRVNLPFVLMIPRNDDLTSR